MVFNRTEIQPSEQYPQAQQLSLQRTRPPTDVPGYEPQRFLGAGSFGQVWVALDRNTGRQVAIKFYSHRGGLDWSLLTREVEKLVFLSADRYVVQLLDVGWDSDPPYYVMEYVEQGSLDDRLRSGGTLPPAVAVELFREVAIGLVHAHGRGVLHCDLKPANVLLDQDGRPRLADFGQSRLTHEQDTALGTLFYMAPEQADLKSVPDARWDVYALGALLYTMLTGAPPHRNEASIAAMEAAPELETRLARYRRLITDATMPTAHRKLRGVDRRLAEIIERCIEPNPNRRFPNAQAVVDALEARDVRRARRPLVLLGMVGPALLVLVMGYAAWLALDTAVEKSTAALTERALASNQFAARAQAEAVSGELDRRFRALERIASDPQFQAVLAATLADQELAKLRGELSNPVLDEVTLQPVRQAFLAHPAREPLQQALQKIVSGESGPDLASIFVNDAQGLQLDRVPMGSTVGKNYSWRSYFHGGPRELPVDWRPGPTDHVRQVSISPVFRSQATGRWAAAISIPIYQGGPEGTFLGVLAMTVEVGHFVKLEGNPGQLAVLVDWRDGQNKGLILQHPLLDRLLEERGTVPERFKSLRIDPADLPLDENDRQAHYRDPVATDPSGAEYGHRWLAAMAPVKLGNQDSGLIVIVQEGYSEAIGRPLKALRNGLLGIGAIALTVVAALLTLLWGLVMRVLGGTVYGRTVSTEGSSVTPATTLATIASKQSQSKP